MNRWPLSHALLSFLLVGAAFADAETPAPSTTVLLIGDSHTAGAFGRELHKKLATRPGFHVASFASWGTSPSAWLDGTPTERRLRTWDWSGREARLDGKAPTPKLDELLPPGESHVDYVIVALGSNLLGAPTAWAEQTTDALMRKARELSTLGCLWVGPPHMKKTGEGKRLFPEDYAPVLAAIERSAAAHGCEWIDSLSMTKYPRPRGDGIHYDTVWFKGKKVARRWARDVFDAFQRKFAKSP